MRLQFATRRVRVMREIRRIPGLVAYWPMNETVGSTCRNYARAAIGQNNGTITSLTIGQPGKAGRAFTFAGSGYVDLTTGYDPSYSQMVVGAILSVDTAGQGNSRTVFAKRSSFSATTMRWQMSFSNLNQVYFGRSASQYAFSSYGNSYPKDTQFLACVQKESGATRLNINGTVVENGGAITDGTGTTAPSRIGATDTTPAEFYRGKMQHFFIVNGQINASRLLKLAKAAGLVG